MAQSPIIGTIDGNLALGYGIKPLLKIDLILSLEYFWGRYYQGELDNIGEDISKFVATLAFWQGW